MEIRQHGGKTGEEEDYDKRENHHSHFFEDFGTGVFGPFVFVIDGVGGEGETEKKRNQS